MGSTVAQQSREDRLARRRHLGEATGGGKRGGGPRETLAVPRRRRQWGGNLLGERDGVDLPFLHAVEWARLVWAAAGPDPAAMERPRVEMASEFG